MYFIIILSFILLYIIIFFINSVYDVTSLWPISLFFLSLIATFFIIPFVFYLYLLTLKFLINEKISKSYININYWFFLWRIRSFLKWHIFWFHRCADCWHELVANYYWIFGSKSCPDCGFYSRHFLLLSKFNTEWKFITENINVDIKNKNKIYLLWEINDGILKFVSSKNNITFKKLNNKKDIKKFIKNFNKKKVEAIFFDLWFLINNDIYFNENETEKLNSYLVNDWNIIVLTPNKEEINSNTFFYNVWIKIEFFLAKNWNIKKNITNSFDFIKKIKLNKEDEYFSYKLPFFERYYNWDYFSNIINFWKHDIVSNLDYHNWWIFFIPKECISKNAKFLDLFIKYIIYYWKIWELIYFEKTYLSKVGNEFIKLNLPSYIYKLFYYSWNDNWESDYFEKNMLIILKKLFWKLNVKDMDLEFLKYKNKQDDWFKIFWEIWKVHDAELNLNWKRIIFEFKTLKNKNYKSIINEYKGKLYSRLVNRKWDYWIMLINHHTAEPNIYNRDSIMYKDEDFNNIILISFYDFLKLLNDNINDNKKLLSMIDNIK